MPDFNLPGSTDESTHNNLSAESSPHLSNASRSEWEQQLHNVAYEGAGSILHTDQEGGPEQAGELLRPVAYQASTPTLQIERHGETASNDLLAGPSQFHPNALGIDLGHGQLLNPVAYSPPSPQARALASPSFSSPPQSPYFPASDPSTPRIPGTHQGDFTTDPEESPHLEGFPSSPRPDGARPAARRGPAVSEEPPPRRQSDLIRAIWQGAQIGRQEQLEEQQRANAMSKAGLRAPSPDMQTMPSMEHWSEGDSPNRYR